MADRFVRLCVRQRDDLLDFVWTVIYCIYRTDETRNDFIETTKELMNEHGGDVNKGWDGKSI